MSKNLGIYPPPWNNISGKHNSESEVPSIKTPTKVPFINYTLFAGIGLAIALSSIISSTYAVMKTEVTTNTIRLRAADNFTKQVSPNEQVNSGEVPLGVNKNGDVQKSSGSSDDTGTDLVQEQVKVQGVPDQIGKAESKASGVMGSEQVKSGVQKEIRVLPRQQTTDNWYRVRKEWNDSKSQIGAFKDLDLAKAVAAKKAGYKVFDFAGNTVYDSTSS